MTRIKLFILLLLCANTAMLSGQDPFFLQFANSESQFNPALTGFRGATSVMLKYKSQWNATDVNGFQSGSLLLEESLPCSIFDYGINSSFDREGAGLLKTIKLGGSFAGTIPWEMGQHSLHNIRAGLGLQWMSKRIDYSRLLFSDELDPKYGSVDVSGVDLPTSFFADNDGRSLWIFAPAVGFSHRIMFNKDKRNAPTLQYGLAVHNAFALGRNSGNIESLLGQNTRIAPRYNLFAMSEFVVSSDARSFLSVRPLFVWQRQGKLSYYELGNRFSLNRNFTLGVHYHFNVHDASQESLNTNWFTFQTEFGWLMGKNKRIDLGLTYAANFTGLRNYLGPILEVSVGVHFASSPSCKIVGRNDEVFYGEGVKCPTSAFTPGKRKMYENIWYKNLRY